MKILKYLLMIVTAPVILVLTLFVWLCTGLIYISGLVLGLICTVIALLLSLIHIYTALYEKMAAEQDKYRDWLKSQPPEEILHHTYEYTIREDIVMAMEELELTDAQAQALLESPSPVSYTHLDVYKRQALPQGGHHSRRL